MALPPTGFRTAQKTTQGGFYHVSIYSGAVAPGLTAAPGAVAGGSDVLLWSGAGRLDTVLSHEYNVVAAGASLPVVFYDSCTPSSGGPFLLSGHRVLAFIPFYLAPASGAWLTQSSGSNAASYPANWGAPVSVGAPFLSGLCVACMSGQAGFTASWTPEANPL